MRRKISATCKRNGVGLWMVGKKHSDETKELMSAQRRGAKHYNWRGGRRINDLGYVLIYRPEHPAASKKGLVREHRLVVERELGRYLEAEEVVYHINGDRADNRVSNLLLFTDQTSHMRFESGKLQDPSKVLFDGSKTEE